jgi:outer membrane protein assembly factor BamB
MAGRGYYSTGGKIYCVDIRTGEQLWVANGGYTFGTLTDTYIGPTRIISVAEYPGALTTTFSPKLVSIGGSRFVKYDGMTGNVLLDIEGIAGTFVGYDGQYAYIVQRDPDAPFYQGSPGAWVDPATYFLYKVDTGGTETDITKRIIYKVEYPFNTVDIGVCLYNNILSLIHFPLYGESGAINTTTGEVLWHRPIGGAEGFIEQKPESVTSGDGVMFFAVQNREFTAVDMATGDVLWYSDKADYPWGNFWAYGQSVAYGNVYALSYAGVYAFDTSTGKINWHYSAGDSGSETPYGSWPFGSADPVVADGKVYAPATEHSPTFYYRGEKLHCIDAYTGDAIWTILGNYRVDAVAEGCLFASNAYDRNKYCFGKGETVTSISVSDEVIAKGSSVLLKGSVLDMSPAQPGTAAISDASMSEWMEYLHMQQPCPADAKGVEVTLDTIDPNGNFIHIGKVTSDMSGMFRHLWTPEIEGAYTVIATFEGSESYYASYAETAIGVGPSVSAGGPIEPEASEPMITTEVALIATAIIVAIAVIAGLWIISLRK